MMFYFLHWYVMMVIKVLIVLLKVKWRDVRVGDVVTVRNGKWFVCDTALRTLFIKGDIRMLSHQCYCFC